MVSLVSAGLVVAADQIVLHDGRVVAPLEDAGPLRKRNDFVLPDLKAPLSGVGVVAEEGVHQAEDLLHHGVLTQVVFAWKLNETNIAKDFHS